MITVIGCGNPARSDDGVGVWVAKQLMGDYQDDAQVRVLDAGTSGLEVMFRARGSSALIIVDAVSSGAEPGQIFEVPGSELENPAPQRPGAHGFRWDHALYSGRMTFGSSFPQRVAVFLIEAGDLSLGLQLTPEVATAATTLLTLIRERIDSYRPAQVRISSGNLFFDRALYQRHLQGTASIALVREAQQVMIFPLHAVEHGGLLLKQRNADGDRIVHAQAFFRDNDLQDSAAQPLDAVWDAQKSALVMNIGPLAS
jgi:hydrogenase maturation protease